MARLGVRLKDTHDSDLRRSVPSREFNDRAVELAFMTIVFVVLIAAAAVAGFALLRQ